MKHLLRPLLSAILVVVVTMTPATAQQLTTAKAVLSANIEATGGLDSWASIRTLHNESEMVMDLDMGTIIVETATWVIAPDIMFMTTKAIDAPAGMPEGALNNRIYVTGDGGYIEGMQGRQSLDQLPGSVREQLKDGMNMKDEVSMLEQPDSTLELLESRVINGTMSYPVRLTAGDRTTRYYAHDSLLLVAVEATGPNGQTALGLVSDYRDVDGLKMAFHTETDMGATGSQTMNVKTMLVNMPLTPEDIEKMSNE